MKGNLTMPYRITSKFFQQESFRNSPHKGIDFAMETGEPLRSIKDGIVTLKNFGSTNAGKTVYVEWDDGTATAIYGHLSDFAVQNGQHVKAGDLIGYAGNTGNSFGSHLHFGLKKDGQFIDPSPYIENIQHMNDPNYFVQSATELKLSFFDFMQQHMDLIGGFVSTVKVNFIHLVSSTDYTPLIKLLQNLIQFFLFNT